MADKKISALTGASTPLAGTEVLPIVQSGATVKVAVSDVTAGRVVSMSGLGIGTASPSESAQINNGRLRFLEAGQRQYNIGITSGTPDFAIADATFSYTPFTVSGSGNVIANTGNFVVGTSGKGIDFSATPGTGTSELLADYEEGTWTPVVTASSGAIVTVGTVQGFYTKIGNSVSIWGTVTVTLNGTGAGALLVAGLPFTCANTTQAGSGCIGSGYNTSSAEMSFVRITAASTQAQLRRYDAAYPIGSGQTIGFSGNYYV